MMRIPAIIVAQIVLLAIANGLNHALSGWQVSLFVLGMVPMFPALHMGAREGLFCCLLAGLLADAPEPVHFGSSSLMLAAAFLFVVQMRPRLPLDIPAVQVSLAIAVNLLLYLARFAGESRILPSVSGLWGRLLWEVLLSSVLVALVAPWFAAFQARLLSLASLPMFRRHEQDSD